MTEFVAGNDPADHTVAEVTAFLKGDDVTGDEYDRVMEAERAREGGGRVGIISLSGAETPVEAEAPEQYDEDAPASLGPDKPQSEAEAEAHAATLKALDEAAENQPDLVERPATQTPEEARARAVEINEAQRRERLGIRDDDEADASDDDNE